MVIKHLYLCSSQSKEPKFKAGLWIQTIKKEELADAQLKRIATNVLVRTHSEDPDQYSSLDPHC